MQLFRTTGVVLVTKVGAFVRRGDSVSLQRKILFLSAAVAAFASFAASPASAQGFFDALFGAFGSREQRPAPTSYAPAGGQPSYDERYPGAAPETRSSGGYGRGGGVYCVRLCDGRYFPVPRAGNGAVSSAKVCNALCPRAQTKVFNGSDPTHSVANDGTRYADLENALVYRERVVPDCSCTGHGPGGLAQIDIESDPTLREGDVVVKPTGLVAFRGSATYPYKSADFTPIQSYARIAADMRKTLSDLKVNTTVQSTAPVERLADARDEPAATHARPSKPRRARVEETRSRDNWNPFADFFR
jgi:hypothetical protein